MFGESEPVEFDRGRDMGFVECLVRLVWYQFLR